MTTDYHAAAIHHSANTPSMTIYITKYALTQGIIAAKQAQLLIGTRYQLLSGKSKVKYTNTYGAKDYATSLAEAKLQAEEKRRAKIANLRKQIARLESLDIEVYD